jgi:lipopolysaccharide/colanic/teichoic acid biosynthesis glycosyltransferase
MSWEQSTANDELTRVDTLESGLPFTTTNTQDTTIATWWDPAAAHKAAKRFYDLFFATLGLILLSPLFLLLALAIKLSDRGPVFYRQKRIGQYGIPFLIWKFRTMVPDADASGPSVTSNDDPRVTSLGRLLRRTKLDEFPQLWNVLRGEMSLVGPRPEVACYVEHYNPKQRAILEHKPGITDLASLRFRNEEALLNGSDTTEEFYVEHCLPRKLKLNEEYARQANLLTDTWIIIQTICPYWAGVLGVYAVILGGSFLFSYVLLENFVLSGSAWREFVGQLPLVVGLQLICLLGRRQCHGLLCYFGLAELWQVTLGLFQAALLLFAFSFVVPYALPQRNVILLNLCISLLFLNGFRILFRLWRERTEGERQSLLEVPERRVGIIGAGKVGAKLARYLNTHKTLGRTTVAFFDDDFSKWHKRIHEIPVVGMPECLLESWSEKLDEVAIALPGPSSERLEELIQLFQKTKLKVYTFQWPLPPWAASENLCTAAA